MSDPMPPMVEGSTSRGSRTMSESLNISTAQHMQIIIFAYTYIHIHIYTYTYTYTHIHIYTHTHIHTRIDTHA